MEQITEKHKLSGSVISEDNRSITDVKRRIGQARCAFNNKKKKKINNKNISAEVRKKTENWCLTAQDVN